MKFFSLVATAFAAAALAVAPAAAADTTTFNSTPTDGWFYGSGNNYSPANTAVQSTDSGNQLYLRMHETFQPAPASNGVGVYSFALGTPQISFDWGIDESGTAMNHRTALITLTNLITGQMASYNPFSLLNDNATGSGSSQNSGRLNWFAALGFNPNIDNTYRVNLSISGEGSNASSPTHSLDVYAKLGNGAVPEPATWAMMLLGFGAAGTALRRRRSLVIASAV